MTTQAWIVMDDLEHAEAIILDDDNARLGARQISNSLANNLGYGALVGKWIAPARLLNDAEYQRWTPTLGQLPIHVMDSDTLFPPVLIDI